MNFFTDTILMMGRKNFSLISGRDKVDSQLESWSDFLKNNAKHPATFDMFRLIEETDGVSLRLRSKAQHQPTFPSSILCLIHTNSNESFCQALERRKRVWWTDFEGLRRALAIGKFQPELVALSGGLLRQNFSPLNQQHQGGKRPHQHPKPPPPPTAADAKVIAGGRKKPKDGPTTASRARITDPPT